MSKFEAKNQIYISFSGCNYKESDIIGSILFQLWAIFKGMCGAPGTGEGQFNVGTIGIAVDSSDRII